MKNYHGGCHCGVVQFEVAVDVSQTMVCNCSHCQMKGFIMVFVPKNDFKLIKGEDSLTNYQFGKKVINHTFCKTCGVESFSMSDTEPKMMVNARCLRDLDINSLQPEKFNGKDY